MNKQKKHQILKFRKGGAKKNMRIAILIITKNSFKVFQQVWY